MATLISEDEAKATLSPTWLPGVSCLSLHVVTCETGESNVTDAGHQEL